MAPSMAQYKPLGYTIASSVVSIGGFLNGFDTGSVGYDLLFISACIVDELY